MKVGSEQSIDLEVLSHFRGFAEEYDDSTEWCGDPLLLASLVTGSASKRSLDFGCGTGLVAQALSAEGGLTHGLDLSYEMLKRAKARIGPRVVAGQAESLPFRSGCKDLLVCRQVLHYTREAEALCEAARVLRPGGELRLAQITSRDERDFAFWTVLKAVMQPLRRRVYSPSLLCTIVERCCFDVRDLQTYCIRRRYSEEDFVRRSPLPARERGRLKSWLREELIPLQEVLDPQWSDGDLVLNQYWTVLLCIRRD